MRIPKHIGIIPDGNRRWAKRAGLEKQDGYAHGLSQDCHAETGKKLQEWKKLTTMVLLQITGMARS